MEMGSYPQINPTALQKSKAKKQDDGVDLIMGLPKGLNRLS